MKQSSSQGGKSIVFSIFYPYAHKFSIPYCGPFCVSMSLFWYIHPPWTRSTKPFTKRLMPCPGMSVSIFEFCSLTPQYLTMDRFMWAWAHSNTYTLYEHAPQNRLRNSWANVEISELLFLCFLPYAHQLLRHLLWSVLHDLGLVQIPSYSVQMLHKTVYKMVEPS